MASSGTDNEFITCPVCQSFYEMPLVMRCGHTFCEKCVDGTIGRAKRVWEHEKPTTKFSNFPCPECNCKCPVPNVTVESLRDKFQINWALKKIADKAEENRLQSAYLDTPPKTTDDDKDDVVSQTTKQIAEASIKDTTEDDDDDINGPKKSSNLQTVTPCHYDAPVNLPLKKIADKTEVNRLHSAYLDAAPKTTKEYMNQAFTYHAKYEFDATREKQGMLAAASSKRDDDKDDIVSPKHSAIHQTTKQLPGISIKDDTEDDDDVKGPKKSSNLQPVTPRHYGATGQRNPVYLSSVGQAVDLASGPGRGAWLLDPTKPDGTAWEINDWISINSIDQYASKINMINKENPIKIKLDVTLQGFGHVIWAGHIYSRIANTFDIVKVDVRSPTAARTVGRLTVPGAGDYNWQCGALTWIDLAVDELGLWAIYGDESSDGKIAVARIDPDTMTITGTWVTKRDKETAGNAFIISGMLYVIDSYKPTKIDYIFDTSTNAGHAVNIPIPGPTHGELYQACYIPGCSKVLVMDDGHIQEYPLTLVDQKPQW